MDRYSEYNLLFDANDQQIINASGKPEWWIVSVFSGSIRVYNRNGFAGTYYDMQAGGIIRIPARDQYIAIQSTSVADATGVVVALDGYQNAQMWPSQSTNVTVSGSVGTQVADGDNVVEGAIADAAVAAGAAGTLSAKLRAISRDLVANIVLAAGSNRIGKVTLRNAANAADIDPLSESDFDTKIGSLTETAPASDTASSGINGRLQRIAQRLTSIIALLPAAFTAGGGVKVGLVDAIPAGTNGIGKLTANSGVIIGDVNVVADATGRAATATLSNVNDQATNVTLLASNANRKGAILHNDSTQDCYVKFGATASATSFTYRVLAGGTLEILDAMVYTGIIDGIWVADASGAMRVTELT